MRTAPIFPAYRNEFRLMAGHRWFQLGDYANCWQIGPLRVIFTTSDGWNHVSVSTETRCPSWNEMEFVKRSLFYSHECVMQLHVPEAEHANFMPYCLHLWAPLYGSIPRPPNHLVGVP